MVLVLLVGGLALIGLPGVVRRLGRTLDPAEWARVCLFSLVAGAVAVQAAVVFVAAPTVLRAVGAPGLASACERMLRLLVPGGPAAGWAAAAVAGLLPALAAVGILRARRSQRQCRIEPWLGRHEPCDGYELVVLPTPSPLAVTVDGRDPQIVISEGLVDTLPPAQVDAVVRHEVAHLANRHQRYLVAATALDHAFAWLPLTRRSTRALRAALERWADESAAAEGATPRATVRDALLGMTLALVGPGVAAFSAAETVIERLDALSAAPPRATLPRRAAIYLPGLVMGAVVLMASGAYAGEVRTVLAMAGRCPT